MTRKGNERKAHDDYMRLVHALIACKNMADGMSAHDTWGETMEDLMSAVKELLAKSDEDLYHMVEHMGYQHESSKREMRLYLKTFRQTVVSDLYIRWYAVELHDDDEGYAFGSFDYDEALKIAEDNEAHSIVTFDGDYDLDGLPHSKPHVVDIEIL